MIFAQILEIVALAELASVLCARKFSFIIIIFKALKLAAAVFMYFFFNLAAAERPQHCALVCIETYLLVYFWKTDVYSPGKIQPRL